jgi:glucosyl-3-phosphoglycerate phosphatase
MTKTVHLIRHGQSTFNAIHDSTGHDPLIYDAPLSALGHQQVAEARQAYADHAYDIVFTSPLTRAIQTAKGIFGNNAPMIVNASHSEWANWSCNMGRPASELARDFPDLDFSHLTEDWWHKGGPINAYGIPCEPLESLLARVASFRALIAARPERKIAIVGHGDFFYHLTRRAMANCERAVMSDHVAEFLAAN